MLWFQVCLVSNNTEDRVVTFNEELKRLKSRKFRQYEPQPSSIISSYVYFYQDKRDNYHLIFRDYRNNEGLCNLTRLYRRFSDTCVNEDIAEKLSRLNVIVNREIGFFVGVFQ